VLRDRQEYGAVYYFNSHTQESAWREYIFVESAGRFLLCCPVFTCAVVWQTTRWKPITAPC
jgi:hypothetical protein